MIHFSRTVCVNRKLIIVMTGVRWVAELHFENETFIQEMEKNSSDAYKNFVQRYSHLVCFLLILIGLMTWLLSEKCLAQLFKTNNVVS